MSSHKYPPTKFAFDGKPVDEVAPRLSVSGIVPKPKPVFDVPHKAPRVNRPLVFRNIKNYEDIPTQFHMYAMQIFNKGGSEVEVQAAFNIPKKSWNEWLNKYPEFRDFVTTGLARSEAWWMELAALYANKSSNSFNAALWFMNMKNRFGWVDKKEVDMTSRGQQIGYVLLPPLTTDPEHPDEMEPRTLAEQDDASTPSN